MPITSAVQDRLLALLRPMQGVSKQAVACGVLCVIVDQPSDAERVEVLAFVFAEFVCAQWSGPSTSPEQYPVTAPGTEAAAEAQGQQWDAPRRRLLDELRVDRPAVEEAARRAWAFLATLPDDVTRARQLALLLTRNECIFAGEAVQSGDLDAVPHIHPVWEHGALFRYRRQVRAILALIAAHNVTVPWEFLAFRLEEQLATVKDPIARAVVHGEALARIRMSRGM